MRQVLLKAITGCLCVITLYRTHIAMSIYLVIAALLPVLCCSQQLVGLKDPRGEWVWNDKGAGSNDFQVWQALLPGSGWKMVGQHAQANYRGLEQPILRFKESDKDKGKFLIKPEGFQFIWDDRGSRCRYDGSVWRPNCPPGSVALGDFFFRANKISVPNGLVNKVACVDVSMAEFCQGFGNKVWIDKGTWAKYNLSVWSVRPSAAQYSTYFYGNSNHNRAPGLRPRCLKKSAYITI